MGILEVVQTLASCFMTLLGLIETFCSVRLILSYGLMSTFKKDSLSSDLPALSMLQVSVSCKETISLPQIFPQRKGIVLSTWTGHSINHPNRDAFTVTRKSASIYAKVRGRLFLPHQVHAICISHYLLINWRVL